MKLQGNASRRTTFVYICTVLLVGSAIFMVSATSTQAQRFGRVASEPFSGRVNFDERRKGKATGLWIDLASTMRVAWQQLRPVLTENGRTFLNERDIGGGFRTSRDVLTLAENGNMYFGVDGTGFTMKYVLRGNRLDTSLRVPGPSPSGTDPRVSVLCDLEVTIDVERSGLNDLVASPARLKANCSRPVGQNFTGTVGIGVNNLIRFLGGPDFIGMYLTKFNSSTYALSNQLNLKFRLLPRRTQNTTIGFSRRNDQLDLIFEEDQPLKVH